MLQIRSIFFGNGCLLSENCLVYVLQLCSEQQESRPLLSPSIDDFQSESKSDGATRPVTSNTAGSPIITALSSVPPLLLTHLLFSSSIP